MFHGSRMGPNAANGRRAACNSARQARGEESSAEGQGGRETAGCCEAGPCRIGVISAVGDRFAVQKFGLTVFETEESEAAVDGWGLDDLVVARVRAATNNDPTVQKDRVEGAFQPFYNPTSRFLADPNEGLQRSSETLRRRQNATAISS